MEATYGNHYKKIDRLGRLVLPSNIRKAMGLGANSEIVMELKNNVLTIRSGIASCKLCGSAHDLDRSIGLCRVCINRIKLT